MTPSTRPPDFGLCSDEVRKVAGTPLDSHPCPMALLDVSWALCLPHWPRQGHHLKAPGDTLCLCHVGEGPLLRSLSWSPGTGMSGEVGRGGRLLPPTPSCHRSIEVSPGHGEGQSPLHPHPFPVGWGLSEGPSHQRTSLRAATQELAPPIRVTMTHGTADVLVSCLEGGRVFIFCLQHRKMPCVYSEWLGKR